MFDAIWTSFKHTCSNQDDSNTVDNVQQVAAIELQKKTHFHKQGLNHVWLHSESNFFTELFKLG